MGAVARATTTVSASHVQVVLAPIPVKKINVIIPSLLIIRKTLKDLFIVIYT
jgi:hypothetical protein